MIGWAENHLVLRTLRDEPEPPEVECCDGVDLCADCGAVVYGVDVDLLDFLAESDPSWPVAP